METVIYFQSARSRLDPSPPLAEIEKEWKARRRDFARFEQDRPERVPHILQKGSDKVACNILKRLADGPRRPAELRAALGIASANFFTARYLTPLAKLGYIAVAGVEKNRFAWMRALIATESRASVWVRLTRSDRWMRAVAKASFPHEAAIARRIAEGNSVARLKGNRCA